jgi:putative Mg2+ transporter-C (MgtC) family protein
MAMIMAGIIGYDRESKNRPAGFRTHIMVCTGATIIALVQAQIADSSLKLALEYPNISNTFVYEQGRLIAQVISGIGFLGAGTIIVTKKFVQGLTTAASLWSVACLGIAIGMGFYMVAVLGFIIMFITLIILSKVINFKTIRHLELRYNDERCEAVILGIFKKYDIRIKEIDLTITKENKETLYQCQYSIEVNDSQQLNNVIELFKKDESIYKIHIINS